MSGTAKRSTVGGFLLRIAIGAAIGVGIATGADPNVDFLSANVAAVPPGALRMTVAVLVLAALFLVGGIVAARRGRFAAAAPTTATGRPKLRRAPKRSGYRALLWQMMLCGWLLFAYPEQWTWASVGMKTAWPIAVSAIFGVAAYRVLIAVLAVLIRRNGVEGEFLDGNMRTMAAICPRSRSQKALAWIAFCALNPITEEILFRGVLIYQTSLVLGSAWLPILVGLFVNIGNHWYQGGRSMLLHIPFYVIAVALLFSPLGLVGAIGFHVAGDVVPMAMVRSQLRKFRERHRRPGSLTLNHAQPQSIEIPRERGLEGPAP